jgi:hypothetical protein
MLERQSRSINKLSLLEQVESCFKWDCSTETLYRVGALGVLDTPCSLSWTEGPLWRWKTSMPFASVLLYLHQDIDAGGACGLYSSRTHGLVYFS